VECGESGGQMKDDEGREPESLWVEMAA